MKNTPSLIFDIGGLDKAKPKETKPIKEQPHDLVLKTIYYTPTPWVWPEHVKAIQEAYKAAKKAKEEADARLRNPDGSYNLDLVALED